MCKKLNCQNTVWSLFSSKIDGFCTTAQKKIPSFQLTIVIWIWWSYIGRPEKPSRRAECRWNEPGPFTWLNSASICLPFWLGQQLAFSSEQDSLLSLRSPQHDSLIIEFGTIWPGFHLFPFGLLIRSLFLTLMAHSHPTLASAMDAHRLSTTYLHMMELARLWSTEVFAPTQLPTTKPTHQRHSPKLCVEYWTTNSMCGQPSCMILKWNPKVCPIFYYHMEASAHHRS